MSCGAYMYNTIVFACRQCSTCVTFLCLLADNFLRVWRFCVCLQTFSAAVTRASTQWTRIRSAATTRQVLSTASVRATSAITEQHHTRHQRQRITYWRHGPRAEWIPFGNDFIIWGTKYLTVTLCITNIYEPIVCLCCCYVFQCKTFKNKILF